jgi:CRISPR-associated protein Csy1
MLQAILAVDPRHAGAHHRLGIIAHQRGELGEAEELLARAVELDPQEPVYAYTLGLVLQDLRDHLGAAASYRDAIRLRPGFAEAWNNLGLALQDAGRLDDARRALEQALRVRPGYAAAEGNLANVLDALGAELRRRHREREARARFRAAWALRPRRLSTALRSALTLPAVPGSLAELEAARADFAHGVEELHAALPVFGELDRDAVLDALARTNFLLAWHGRDDLALQTRYGDFVHAALAQAAPQWMRPLARRSGGGGRIRVGFASRLFHRCPVGLRFKGWITGLDRRGIEVTVVSLSPNADEVTAEVRAASDRFLAPAGRTGEIASAIRGLDLDVLVYPELGLDAQAFALAALRLAPLQCAGWGHPVTSGLPNVDVFLSAAAAEPPGAASHYRERLVLLPGLGGACPRPAMHKPRSRADLGLPPEGTLYLFPHPAFMVHPDNDALLARVLAADPRGVLVTPAGQDAEAARAIGERLRAAAGVNAGRIVALPAMPDEDSPGLAAACDVVLDALHASGGAVGPDALASAVPVVTLPGALMRGRRTAAMLEMAGVPELVARDADDYVRIAARLGIDAPWRAEMSARLAAGSNAVFDRREPVEALQRFFETGTV